MWSVIIVPPSPAGADSCTGPADVLVKVIAQELAVIASVDSATVSSDGGTAEAIVHAVVVDRVGGGEVLTGDRLRVSLPGAGAIDPVPFDRPLLLRRGASADTDLVITQCERTDRVAELTSRLTTLGLEPGETRRFGPGRAVVFRPGSVELIDTQGTVLRSDPVADPIVSAWSCRTSVVFTTAPDTTPRAIASLETGVLPPTGSPLRCETAFVEGFGWVSRFGPLGIPAEIDPTSVAPPYWIDDDARLRGPTAWLDLVGWTGGVVLDAGGGDAVLDPGDFDGVPIAVTGAGLPILVVADPAETAPSIRADSRLGALVAMPAGSVLETVVAGAWGNALVLSTPAGRWIVEPAGPDSGTAATLTAWTHESAPVNLGRPGDAVIDGEDGPVVIDRDDGQILASFPGAEGAALLFGSDVDPVEVTAPDPAEIDRHHERFLTGLERSGQLDTSGDAAADDAPATTEASSAEISDAGGEDNATTSILLLTALATTAGVGVRLRSTSRRDARR